MSLGNGRRNQIDQFPSLVHEQASHCRIAMPEQKQQIYTFDNYRLDVSNRQLLHDGKPLALPAKAFDMLVVLIENGGRLVGKDELFSRVWPDQIVEESNLAVHVSAICLPTISGRTNPGALA
jgi:DNA-binding response OmpR family regulator